MWEVEAFITVTITGGGLAWESDGAGDITRAGGIHGTDTAAIRFTVITLTTDIIMTMGDITDMATMTGTTGTGAASITLQIAQEPAGRVEVPAAAWRVLERPQTETCPGAMEATL
jgi:hypothetical protein